MFSSIPITPKQEADFPVSYDEVLEKYQKCKGEKPWIRGQAMDNLMDFSYLDLREDIGLIVECYRNIAPGRPAIDYDPQ